MNRKKPRKSQGNQNKLRRYFQYISADSKEHQQESHAKTEITKHLAVKCQTVKVRHSTGEV